ncbi:MAG: uL23 family ribosomal protein [Patescibacteria group bacterium]
MAIFGTKDTKDNKGESNTSEKREVNTNELLKKAIFSFNTDEVLRSPRITEKAALQNQYNVYVFEVRLDANKRDIDHAVRSIYNVSPKKIRTAPVPRKRVQRRKGGRGFTSRRKKAYVYLKEGDSISLI